MNIHFYKYQGTGNDFIMIDDRNGSFPIENHSLVARLCDRKFGIGADGLILLQKNIDSPFYMYYYNSDGNQSSMCGNGGRCIAAFAHYLKIADKETTFKAFDGVHEALISGEEKKLFIKLKMQNVSDIKISSDGYDFVLNTGSPHFVKFISQSLSDFPLVEEAKEIRYNDKYKAEGINVNIVNLAGLKKITMRTYERGVEDETLSCGTGVTAAALSAAILNNLPNGIHTIDVTTLGGVLSVKFDYHKQQQSFSDIWLQGSATFVFEGDIEV